MRKYIDFLKSKMSIAEESGFDIDECELNPALMPHQKDIVRWALKGGRRAVFARFGLGKTVIELEFCRQAVKRLGGRALIVLPLGVKQEFERDAQRILNIEKPEYVRNMDEANSNTCARKGRRSFLPRISSGSRACWRAVSVGG